MFSDGFIWFGNYGMRPALAALILYVIVMRLFFCYGECTFARENAGIRLNCRKLLPYVGMLIIFLLLQHYQSGGTSEEIWFLNVLESYLEIEDVLVAVLLLLTAAGWTFVGNVHQYLNSMLKIVRYVCVFSIYGNFLTGLCTYSVLNVVLLVVLWLTLIITAGCAVAARNSNSTNTRSSYAPIETYDDLSPNFKRIADQMVQVIRSDLSSTYSICLAGDWGVGKTSIIHGMEYKLRELSAQPEQQCEERANRKLYEKLREKLSRKPSSTRYEIIHINALELDTTESLFLYLFSRIKQILKEQGVYVGLGSTYRTFIGSAVDTITQSSLSILLEGELFAQNEDYRVQKQALSDLIAKAMHSGRIIVVVDDIERCEKEKIKEYLFFIKEIASLECCIPIFVTDYNRLVEQIKDSSENPHIFLDKFFNYTIYVTCSAAEDVVKEMQEKLNQVTNIMEIPYFQNANIATVLEKFRKKLDDKLADMRKKEKNSEATEKGKPRASEKTLSPEEKINQKFQMDIDNTRTIIHICKKIIQYYEILKDEYGDDHRRLLGVSDEQIEKYGKQIQLHDLIFFVAYIECCMPLEFKNLAKSSYDYLIPRKDGTEEYLEVKVMAVDLLSDNEDSTIDKAIEFVSTLVNGPEKLLEIVDWYGNRLQKAKMLLFERKFNVIKDNWDEIMRRLLQEQYLAFQQSQRDDEAIIRGLIEYLKSMLNTHQITTRDILEAMTISHYGKFFVSRVGFMDKLKNLISSYPVSISREEELCRQLNIFKVTYVWAWFVYYMRLIEFTSINKVNWSDSINFWVYDYLGKDISTEVFIEKAIGKILSDSKTIYNEPDGETGDAVDKLAGLTNCLCDKCSKSKVYPEIAYNLSYIKCAVGEIKSWMEIEHTVIKDDVTLDEIDISDICQCISYFENTPINNRERMGMFDQFIMSLEDCTLEDTDTNRAMLWKLHDLVSHYLQQNQLNYTQYRRILCNLERKMTTREASEHEI